MSLAQQSLLYAPSRQKAAHQVAQHTPSHQALFQEAQVIFQQPQFPPSAPLNPFQSQSGSFDYGHRWSDPGRRPSFGQPDWVSSNSTPGSRYSQVCKRVASELSKPNSQLPS